MELPKQLEKLRDKKVWINYVMIYNENKHNGAGGYDKPPVNPHTLKNGQSTNPESWGTFDECNAQIGKTVTISYKKGQMVTREIYGVGIILSAAGLVGLDLDEVVRRGHNGNVVWIAPEAKKIWQYVNSYTEVSISGTGIHILAYGRKPSSEVCRVKNKDGTEYEIYDNNQYFTFSGKHLTNSPGLENRNDKIKEIYEKLFKVRMAQREQTPTSLSVVSCTTSGGSGYRREIEEDDGSLWEKMFRSRRGSQIKALYDGYLDTAGGDDGSHSAADLALCNHLAYWTNNDETRIDRMFRQSGLYRAKWERYDYRTKTIRLALSDKQTYHEYTPEEKKRYAQEKERQEREAAKQKLYNDPFGVLDKKRG